jgi:hypothetical protein
MKRVAMWIRHFDKRSNAMRKILFCSVALAAGVVAPNAQAWEQFIGGGPGWVQNLAPTNALSVDAADGVCAMTNDRVYGSLQFAHVLAFASDGSITPKQLMSGNHAFSTLGMDCRFGDPVAAYAFVDSYNQRRIDLTGFFAGVVDPWMIDLPSIGAVRPAHLSAGSDGRSVVLREKTDGTAYDLLAFDAPMPTPQWQSTIDAWRFPGARVLDFAVGADGVTRAIGGYDRAGDQGLGVFVLRYAADGSESFPLDWPPDLYSAEVGPAALAPSGTAYFARRDTQFQQDTLWRAPADSAVPFIVDPGCCGPVEIQQLAALPDDGVLVATQSGYGGMGRLSRYSGDGSLLWQGDAIEVAAPGFQLLGIVGDRAGRALTVATEPGYDDPMAHGRRIALRAYDAGGSMTWSRLVEGVRFDEGASLRLAVTSADRIVLAFNAYDDYGINPGIRVQVFDLGSPSL